MSPLLPFLLFFSSTLACDPDLTSVLHHKCDNLPFRTLKSQFECVASTPINYDCGQLAFLGGITERILVSSSRAAQYIRQGLMSDENSQICLIQWKGICDGGDRFDDFCIKVEESQKSWQEASSDCESGNYQLFSPHDDDDLQKFWSYVREYSSEDYWLGAATGGNQWYFSDQKTVDFFRLFPDTFGNQSLLSCNSTGGGGGGSDDWWDGDWWSPLPRPSKRQIDGWPEGIGCKSAGKFLVDDVDLWPDTPQVNCTAANSGNCGLTPGSEGALALIFHSKSQIHAYLGYEAVRMASDRYPYVCVKPSSPYIPQPPIQPVTTPPPPPATTTFRDVWPDA